MTLETSSFTTYSAKGNREDLSDLIYNIDPIDTPFLSSVEKYTATAVLHEWQTDALAAASSSNAVLEGDALSVDAATATTRLSNTAQIMDKAPRVTGTQEAVLKAGRSKEMAYQVEKRIRELKRDLETTLLDNTAEVTGNATTARKLGSINAWYASNTSRGTGGSDGAAGNTAATNGTQRAFTEALLQTVLASVWDNGGDPDCIMLGSFNKQKFSTFTGNATRQKDAMDKKLMAAIDIYDSDFGELQVLPNRFQRARDAHIIEKRMWGVAFLREFRLSEIGKTGDNETKLLVAEATLQSSNEGASGIVADLSTS
jgi:hypothetical protein